MKRVNLTLAKDFVCERCVESMKGIVKPAEELTFYDQVELVKSLTYLGNRLMPVLEIKQRKQQDQELNNKIESFEGHKNSNSKYLKRFHNCLVTAGL